jgi:RNA polymerase sigma-70 factor (ECF subfamily)
MRRLEDYTAAEDLLAEAFLVAWRRFDERPVQAEELFWLYGIAGRVLYNVMRSQRRSLRLETRLAIERESEGDVPRYTKEEVEDLMDALGALSLDDVEIIQLAYWEKLSYREIGAALQCSENAAGIRLSRARQRLRDQLNDVTNDAAVLQILREENT